MNESYWDVPMRASSTWPAMTSNGPSSPLIVGRGVVGFLRVSA